MGVVLPKCVPLMDEFEYMLPIRLIASCGYPKSDIIVSSLPWSVEPNAFLKSIYNKKMSYLVSLESFRTAMMVCNCLEVHFPCLNPS
jgi:hypothetical protein